MSLKVFQELKIRAQLDPVVRRKLAACPLQFLANLDLSFDEKRDIILPHFTWILENRLASMPFPPTEDATSYLNYSNAQAAIDHVRKLRPGSIETEEQEAVIFEYEHAHQLLKEPKKFR